MRTKSTLRTLCLSLLALAAPVPAHAEAALPSTFDELLDRELSTTGGLTADDAARDATLTSPTLAARSAELEAAVADVDRATLAYVPQTSVSARYARLSPIGSSSLGNLVATPPDTPAGLIAPGTPLVNVPIRFETPLNQYTFQANLLVPVSDYFLRVAPNRDAASLSRQAAEASVESTKQRAAADARIAYYAWVRARLGVVVAEQALDQAEAHLTDARAMLDAGSGSPADVLRVEAQVARSELLLTQSRTLSELTEEQLRTAMHAAPERALHIGEDIRKPASARPNPPLPALVSTALAARPDLAALDAAQGSRERGIRVERAAYLPRVDLFADGQYSNPNPRVFPTKAEFRGSWDAGAQLTFNLSDLPSTAARVRADEARYAARAAERAALVDQIRLEVVKAREDSEEARVAEGTTGRALAAAEEAYRTRRLSFENGRATSLELLDSETELTAARLDALGARIDVRAAEVRLAYALGSGECLTPGMRGTKFGAREGCP